MSSPVTEPVGERAERSVLVLLVEPTIGLEARLPSEVLPDLRPSLEPQGIQGLARDVVRNQVAVIADAEGCPRIAEEFRSEGQGLKAKISGRMVREQKEIESEAYRQSQETVAKADADAARIFSEAYSQDPEFYAFWRSLAAYEKVVGGNHTLVIAPDAPLYRYLFAPRAK